MVQPSAATQQVDHNSSAPHGTFPASMTQSLGPEQFAHQLSMGDPARGNVTMSVSRDSHGKGAQFGGGIPAQHNNSEYDNKSEAFYLTNGVNYDCQSGAEKPRMTNGVNDMKIRPACLFEDDNNPGELGRCAFIFGTYRRV